MGMRAATKGLLAASVAVVACGAGLPPPAWSIEMSKGRKAEFMKTYVAPRMGKVFQSWDAKRYADFGCKTCHGPSLARTQKVLPKLKMTDGTISAFADKHEIAKVMFQNVAPEMASILGVKPYDPATHEGFGCGGCHAIDM
jgi:hypothetical protein